MPNEISNAVGTARQFTPQPDATYQGRYQGVGVREVNPARSKWLDVADNMTRLSNAFDSYNLNHEKYLSAVGEQDATAMINSMTAEDMEKLNTIDAAQLYGFADTASNPYFRAYADKLRGNFLGTKMKEDYDAKYAMSPAQSGEEELKRYQEYSKSWRKEHLEDTRLENEPAFNKGFNENSVVNMSKLYQTWNKKKNEDDVRVTIAQVNSELGDVIENSVELLKENGAMTNKVQSIFNETRLMGLPFAYRQQLLQQFTDEIIKTGHIPANRLEQMLDGIDIMTTPDGETVKASSLLDMQATKTYAFQFNRQFHTQSKADWVENYRKQGKAGLIQARKDVEGWRESDPEKAQEYNALLPQIDSLIKQDEARQAADRRAAMFNKGSARGGKGSGGVKDDAVIDSVITAWLENKSTSVDGKPISAYKFNEDTFFPKVWNELNYYAMNKNPDGFFRMMSMPQMEAYRTTFSADLSSRLAAIRPTDDGGVNIGGDPKMMSLVQMIATNPNSIEYAFGSKVAKQGRLLKNFMDITGDFNVALRRFAEYNNTDESLINENESKVKNYMNTNGWDIDWVRHLDTINKSSEDVDKDRDTISFKDNMNPSLRVKLIDLATTYSVCGYDIGEAVNRASQDIQNNYFVYHWGGFPQGVFYDMHTDDNQGWFTHGLDQLCYRASGGNPADSTHISYDSDRQMFYATNWDYGGHAEMSLAEVREYAMQDYNRALTWRAEHPDVPMVTDDTTMTVDEANIQREVSAMANNNDDYDNTYEESETASYIDEN